MPNLESPTNQSNNDALADKKASANAEIEQANYLYSQVLKMSQDWDSVDVVKAQLIIAYGQDAVESRRWNAKAWYSNGAGPLHSASGDAGTAPLVSSEV